MKTDKKMVLAIDEPENCRKCPLQSEVSMRCAKEGFFVYEYSKRRHPDCPLKYLPEKLPTEGKESRTRAAGYAYGWNDCIDEMGGKDDVT